MYAPWFNLAVIVTSSSLVSTGPQECLSEMSPWGKNAENKADKSEQALWLLPSLVPTTLLPDPIRATVKKVHC